MRVTVSKLDRPGPLVVVNTPEEAALVLTFDEPGLPALHDLTATAADLVLLALSEPPGPAPAADIIEPGRVSLITQASLASGLLEIANTEVADRCFAALINQFSGEVLTFDVSTVLTLVARGVAIQITSGLAATAARDLDDDLKRLDETR